MTAPLHERVATLAKETRLDAADMGGRGRHVRCRELLDHAAMLDEAAAALRPPEGEVGNVCERLDQMAALEEKLTIDDEWHKRRAADLRAALAHLRRLAAVEAERDRLRGALDDIADMHIGDCPASLAHLTDAEWAQRCHMHLRRTAIAALAPAPAAEDAR